MRVAQTGQQIMDVVKNNQPIWLLIEPHVLQRMSIEEVNKLICERRLGLATNESIQQMRDKV
jgi:hypothetical protein